MKRDPVIVGASWQRNRVVAVRPRSSPGEDTAAVQPESTCATPHYHRRPDGRPTWRAAATVEVPCVFLDGCMNGLRTWPPRRGREAQFLEHLILRAETIYLPARCCRRRVLGGSCGARRSVSRSCRPSWPTCATLLDASDIRALVAVRCPRDGGEVLRRARASRSEVFRRSLVTRLLVHVLAAVLDRDVSEAAFLSARYSLGWRGACLIVDCFS